MISPTAFATLLDDLIRDANLKGVVETATTDLRPIHLRLALRPGFAECIQSDARSCAE